MGALARSRRHRLSRQHGARIAAGAVLLLGRIPRHRPPGLGAVLPVLNRCTLLMDVGGTVRCKRSTFLQFAQMGSIYMKLFRNVRKSFRPASEQRRRSDEGRRVDLRGARALIEQTEAQFPKADAEGKDIPNGISDVVVCDGFTGNVIIKFGEGLGELIQSQLKEEYMHHMLRKSDASVMLPAMKRIIGALRLGKVRCGSPVLGVCGSVVKVHGRSRANAIANAITSGANFIRHNGVERIQNEIAKARRVTMISGFPVRIAGRADISPRR